MEDILEIIGGLKTDAKYERDNKHYPDAVEHLAGDEGAISLLRQEMATQPSVEWKTRLATELADCLGLLGGIQRRWAISVSEPERSIHLQASVEAYKQGYEIEQDPAYNIVNSYNMVNRLVSYILLEPESLDDIEEELTNAKTAITEQLQTKRRGDIWAMADLALVDLLLENDNPESAYANFNAQSPPAFAYESALSTLIPLTDLATHKAARLKKAIALLEARWQKLKG